MKCTAIGGRIDNTSHWRLARPTETTLTMPRLCLRRSWYFCLHITCILMVMVLPVKSRRRQTKEQQDKQLEHNSTDNNCNQKDKATWGWGTGVPLGRGNTWDELTWELEFGRNKWKVFTWPRTKKQLDALKIPTGRKVDDLSTLSVARMTANTLLTRV